MASEPAPGGDAAHAAEGHGDHKAELLHWDASAALWSMAVFVILLVILRVAAWKPILPGLKQRENFIRDSLAKAQHESEAAERS
ncbi:MAG: hypothetical protein IPK83_21990 [Planctomycetes bacterium]|nr:hypothetical protein [Planctomycetota bacterium]